MKFFGSIKKWFNDPINPDDMFGNNIRETYQMFRDYKKEINQGDKMNNDFVITNERSIRDRMRQIKENREKFAKEDRGIILSSKEFMSLVNKYADSCGKYLCGDDISCAYVGISDIDKYEDYFCAIEDLTEEEIKKIDSLKPQPPSI